MEDRCSQYQEFYHNLPSVRKFAVQAQSISYFMQYISNFSSTEKDAHDATLAAFKWFQTEKPNIRCQVKDVKAFMKPCEPP